MKRLTKFASVLFITFLLLGCNNSDIPSTTNNVKNTPLSYDKFKNKIKSIKQNYRSKDFISISPEEFTITTTSFPNHKIDKRQIDAVNDDIRTPTRYETFYKSIHNNLLIKVNFIYFPESKKSKFITVNSISPTKNSNIADKYDKVKRPLMDEYLLSFDGYLVLLNFISINQSNKLGFKELNTAFISSEVKFYDEFEKTLLAN